MTKGFFQQGIFFLVILGSSLQALAGLTLSADSETLPQLSSLEKALSSGDLKQAASLLEESGLSPSTLEDKDRIDLMLAAASSGRLEVVKFLEARGFEVNVMGRLDVVKFLEVQGVKVDVINKSTRETPLSRAARSGDAKLIQYLLSKGCEKRLEMLFDAVRNPNLQVFKILSKGANLDLIDSNNEDLLHLSARYASDEVFSFILKSGKNPADDERGVHFHSALFDAACYQGDEETAIKRMKLLVKKTKEGYHALNEKKATLLHAAVECGQLKVAQFLVDAGLSLSAKDKLGQSPVFAAVKSGKAEIVNFFLDKNIDVKEKDNGGHTLLMEAVRANPTDFAIPSLLIKRGADVNVKRGDDETALNIAANSNSLSSIKELFKAGARPATKEGWASLLNAAISRAHPEEVLGFILSEGRGQIDLNARDPDASGNPLERLVDAGNFEAVKILIDAGASIFAPKLLVRAVWSDGDLHLVKLLLEKGAKFASAEEYRKGLTLAVSKPEILKYLFGRFDEYQKERAQAVQDLLIDAARHGAIDSIRFLLEKGADPLKKDKWDWFPVSHAIRSGNAEAVKLLLTDKKLLKSHPRLFQDTLLATAVSGGNVEVVKELVRSGADLKEKDNQGRPLLSAAISSNMPAMVEYLLKNGADPKERYAQQAAYAFGPVLVPATPLHEAAKARLVSPKIISSLVEAGADLNAQDDEGRTPLFVALLSLNFKAADRLLELGADPSIVDKQGRSPLKELKGNGLWNTLDDPFLWRFLEALGARQNALKTAWDRWVKEKKNQKSAQSGEASIPLESTKLFSRESGAFSDLSHFSDETLVKSLVLSMDDKKFPEEPPSGAPGKLKKIYKNLKAARFTPEALKGDSLEIEDTPASYYREILKGASTIRAQSASRDGQPYVFNPTPEQAKKVLNIMLSDPNVSEKDLESLAWLMVRSKISLDAKLLDQFKIAEDKLQTDVNGMLMSEPFQYKGSSSFAAIKLIKALLSYSDDKFECAEGSNGTGGSARDERISRILNWFGNYGNNPDADRVFFAKLARLVLEKKKICSRDRDILINAMRDWKGANAMVQNEIACAVSQSLGSAPLSGREIEEFTIISETVGLRSELNQGSWLEQMKAFGQLLAHHGGGELSGDEQEVYNGLLKFVLGTPEGVVKREVGGEEKKFFSFPKSDANGGQVVKLCKILKRMGRDKEHLSEGEMSLASGASLWLQLTREKLDSARKWPEGFEAPGFDMKQTIREEMRGEPKLAADLVALETSCEVVPGGDGTPESYTEREARIKARQRPRTRTKSGRFDFSTEGRR